MATTYMMHKGGKVYYATTANPASTDAAAQVSQFTENTQAETTRVPGTMSQAAFDKVTSSVHSLTIEFLDDSDTAGSGGFFEFLATNAENVVYLVWQPTGSTTPKAEYKCTAVRPTRGGPARQAMLSTVTLPVETITDTFPT